MAGLGSTDPSMVLVLTIEVEGKHVCPRNGALIPTSKLKEALVILVLAGSAEHGSREGKFFIPIRSCDT